MEYAIDTKWARVTEDALETALSCCRGVFQEAVVRGQEAISCSTLRGKASDYSGRYKDSIDSLRERLEYAGLYVHEIREKNNRRVLVIEQDVIGEQS